MSKIPFNIKFRPQIESGEYKVETRDGRRVRIICWDCINKHYPIIALVPYEGDEISYDYTNNGHYYPDDEKSEEDLFIIIPVPEPELSEFEKELESFYNHHLQVCTYDNQGTVEDSLRDGASKLLAIAKKELLSEKMLIGHTYNPDINKAHELGRKEGIALGKAEALKEIEQDPESSYAFKRGVEYGKEEALKDLPRWIDDGLPTGSAAIDISGLCGFDFLRRRGRLLRISAIEKLPGFKEDGHE